MTTFNLQQILKIAIPFASKEGEQHNIDGVRFEVGRDKIKAIATDSKILIVLDVNFENVNNLEQGKYTIEYNSAKKLMALLKSNPDYKILESDIVKIKDDFVDYTRLTTITTITNNTVEKIRLNPIGLKCICNASIEVLKIDKYAQPVFTFGLPDDPVRCNLNSKEYNISMFTVHMQINPY